jgi:hypothetical protein
MKAISRQKIFCGTVIFFLAGFLASGCSKILQPAGSKQPISAPATEINPAQLKDGLAALYLYNFNDRHINFLPKGEHAVRMGRPGKPIPYLNHRFGAGDVFDSGANRKIGVQMSGYIYLSDLGSYNFKAKSNDGIRIFIDNHMIINDSDVHSDRFSKEGVFEVNKGGWYPILVRYFQRKGTATLEFYWQPPGAQEYIIVPAEAYGHIPTE